MNDHILKDEYGKRVVQYDQDKNIFYNGYGDVLYCLWDFFFPHQIEKFKKQMGCSGHLWTKQGKRVEFWHI